MNSRCFKLCRVYFNSLKKQNICSFQNISVELNSGRPYPSLEKETKIRIGVFKQQVNTSVIEKEELLLMSKTSTVWLTGRVL